MLRFYILHLFIFLFSLNSFCQEITVVNYRKELNIKLNVIDDKRIEKGVNMLNEANKTEDEAIALLESLSDIEKMTGTSPIYKKAIKQLLEASEITRQGHSTIYTVFNENCIKFKDGMKKMQHYASGMNKALYYEQTGEKTVEKSSNIRSLLLQADKPEWIQYKMREAFELEKLAIRDKGRALQIYQDFPVEYNYGWDNDVTPEELAKVFNNPIVNLPPEEVFKAKPVEEQKIPEEGPITFHVQIAAHNIHLTDENIKAIYKGKETVVELQEGIWYKYQIGSFNNFIEANEALKNCHVQNAFIVVYQDGNRLSIKTAMMKIRQTE